MLRRMTRELSRQEVATWKKVIRVISHELNNSLAPIRSLAHSGRELAAERRARNAGRVFDTIEERATHLERLRPGYAHFAKLPTPQLSAVEWKPFLESLRSTARSSVWPAAPDRAGLRLIAARSSRC